ncbi:metal ABC transporter substrate-binding protein [Boudabousia liubingyangii]|uniref:metal ABC transporter substrate-binding protein n=1 Tax=Boudabousia liubingyangii TaxID=1921764 RepID=UPI00093B9324|nr:metal ABC transporter substrate-binding protein [Boudabousia liubingyangii]OKL47503.1 metal ABC transporter substrate-binding protein [Boudabousia liubingyangii]
MKQKLLFTAFATCALALGACSAGNNCANSQNDSQGARTPTQSTTSENPSATNPEGKPVVLTTFTVLADISQNIAGDHLKVESITKPGAEIHDYEPTPGDLARAQGAKLIIDHGMGLETWFEKFIHNAKVPHVVVSEGVTPIPIEGSEHANPHTWMSPTNVQKYADNLAKAFSELDPAHAADYRKNAEKYKAELGEIKKELDDSLAKLPENERVLSTCEGAFSYLAKDAGLKENYLWPVNSESEVTAQQITKVINNVKQDQVKAVFCESTVNRKAMDQVISATGTQYGGTLFVDSLSAKDGPVPTYLDLIRYDSKTIADGLSGHPNPEAQKVK